jgi:DNA-directed RNA polymerase II subunit RPB1
MDAVYIERQKFESLTFAKKEFLEKYELCVSDEDFGIDPATGLHFMEPDIIEDCKNEPEVQFLLDRELEILKEDQATLRLIMANREAGRESDPMSYAPGNIQRVIMNATQQFRIDRSQPSDLHPKDIITKVNSLINKLVVVQGFDTLSMEAQENATTAYRILIRSMLASKRVLLEFRLSEASLDWILGEIEARFHLAKVNPGEMAGVLAAQSIGEPATQMTLNVSRFLPLSCLDLSFSHSICTLLFAFL